MKATYSPLHQRWVVQHPTRPELVIGSGHTQEEAIRKAGDYVARHAH
ncbi:hypothetical protein ACOTHJ_15920 [Achromobacter xylosoxidans]